MKIFFIEIYSWAGDEIKLMISIGEETLHFVYGRATYSILINIF